MLTGMAQDASLTSPKISQTFGKNTHEGKFNPKLRSRSTIDTYRDETQKKPKEKRQEYQDRELSPAFIGKLPGL